MSHVVIVLAAGLGTRMKSGLVKVAHPVAGRPMLSWMLDAVAATHPQRTMVVLGHGADVVASFLPDTVEWCIQPEQRGTGHAVQVALGALGDLDGADVLIVPGDAPIMVGDVLEELVSVHTAGGSAVTLLASTVSDPFGYGRIIRDQDGSVVAVIEERDANDEVRSINEINAGMYVFDSTLLASHVASLKASNDQGELYLTDVVEEAVKAGQPVAAVSVPEESVLGVNSQQQLAEAALVIRDRIIRQMMGAGVRVIDPTRVYVDATVTVDPGVTIYPGVHLEGATTVGAGTVLGPDVYSHDSVIGADSHVWYSVLRGARVGDNCEVGPFASLRPGTVMAANSKVGTFVETKNTTVGEGSKVPHLSYIGDATLGRGVNVGAGSITCNYDGYQKHETHIGDGAFIGSDTMLVAPVSIGDGAVTGAGSTITQDVEPGGLAVERSEQRTIPGYAERRAARYRAARAEETVGEEDR